MIAEELDPGDVVRFALIHSACSSVVRDLVASPFIYVWNSKHQEGFSSLLSLVFYQRKDLIIKLLKRGVDVNVQDPVWKETALHSASMNGLINMVKLLLERGASWTIKSKSGDLAVHFAAQGGHANIVDLFLRISPALVFASNHTSANLLHQAAQNGHLNVTELLCQRGVIPQLDGFLRTPLVIAASFGHLDIVSRLLDFQPFSHLIDHPGNDGYSPLHWAAFRGRADIARKLVQKGARLTVGGVGETPFHVAAKGGNCGVIEVFLEGGFRYAIDTPRNDGHTPLHLAVRGGHIVACSMLLLYRANPHIPRPDGLTVLQYAAVWKQKPIFNLLMEHGANINAPNSRTGSTALHLVAGQGDAQEEDVRLLLDRGAIYDHLILDKDGNTVLHHAAVSGSKEVVAFLLTKVNYDKLRARNRVGLTVLGSARSVGRGRAAVIKLFEQAERRFYHGQLGPQASRV